MSGAVKLSPDLSFEREGRPLASWLLDLVSDDRPTRQVAGEALGGMWYGTPRFSIPLAALDPDLLWQIDGQQERFAKAVRSAVDSQDFPRLDFVRRLCRLRIAHDDDWCRRVDQVGSYGFLDRQAKKVFRQAESSQASGHMASYVFGSLTSALLADPEGLRAMLSNRQLFHEAAQALARIGRPAVAFAGYFLDLLDQPAGQYGFEGAFALGAIGRDESEVVDAVLRRLRQGDEQIRYRAASVLEHMGPQLAGRTDEALQLLLEATCSPILVHAATPALASVGRDRIEALERVLEIAAPRPPRWRSEPSRPHDRYDEVMAERGTAIEALRYFVGFPERVIPVLLNAKQTFVEFDSDYMYGCGRVEQVLAAFGR
jgi:hypothetical protein